MLSSSAAPVSNAERALHGIWSEVLGVDKIGVHDDFFDLGGDSLLSIRILARAGKANIRLSPQDFFDYPTIAGQARRAKLAQTPRIAQTAVTGSLPLMPCQHWFFAAIPAASAQWNLSYRFNVNQQLRLVTLQRAFAAVLKTHDALRSEFIQRDGTWHVSMTKPKEMDVVSELDLTTTDDTAVDRAVRAQADQMNQSFDLGAAPLLRACLVRTASAQPDQLVLVIHHLIVDAESWNIIVQDLTLALTQIMSSQAPDLPAKTDSLKTWSTHLATMEADGKFDAAAQYYAQALSPLPVELSPTSGSVAPEHNTEGQVANLEVMMPAAQTTTFIDAVRDARSSTFEALLCAVACALGERTQDSAVRLEVEGHGRDACLGELDVSRTVGWLTSVYPVVIRPEQPWSDVSSALRATKTALRDVPDKGLSYDVLRYGTSQSDAALALRRVPDAAVLLNFLGQRNVNNDGHLLELCDERCGQARSPDAPRPYLLEINTWLQEDQLTMNLAWPRSAFSSEQMQAFADAVLQTLRALGGDTQGTAVPQDFPLADLDQKGLDDLSAILDILDD